MADRATKAQLWGQAVGGVLTISGAIMTPPPYSTFVLCAGAGLQIGLSVWGVWGRQSLVGSAASRTASRWSIVLALILILAPVGWIAYTQPILAAWLPGLYPTTAAQTAIVAHFESLNRLLNAEDDDALLASLQDFACSYVRSFAQSTLFPKWARAAGVSVEMPASIDWRQDPRRDDLLKVAHWLRSAYPGHDSVSVEFIARRNVPLPQEKQRHFALVRYEGRFIIDPTFEDFPVALFIEAITNPDSSVRRSLALHIRGYYPEFAPDRFFERIGNVKLNLLMGRGALEQVEGQTQSLGAPDSNRMLNGYQLDCCSIEVLRVDYRAKGLIDRLRTNLWRVQETGVWVRRRQRDDDSSIPVHQWID